MSNYTCCKVSCQQPKILPENRPCYQCYTGFPETVKHGLEYILIIDRFREA